MSANILPPSIKQFTKLLSRISYPGFEFLLKEHPCKNRWYLQVSCPGGVDNDTGEPSPWTGRKWDISEHMVNSEFVRTVFKAVLVAEEHEVYEKFRVDGIDLFSPHIDFEKQLELRKQPNSLETRTNGMQGP